MNKKNKIIIIIGIIVLIFLLLTSKNIIKQNFNNKNTPKVDSTNSQKQEEFSGKFSKNKPGNLLTKTSTLEIDGKSYESEIIEQTNVYDFMNKLRNEGKINFTEKNYTGIGKFIVSINNIKSDGEKNWIYYVNGVKAQVGVSNYKIYPGDKVSWKYEKYE